jgi:hypothetical protein
VMRFGYALIQFFVVHILYTVLILYPDLSDGCILTISLLTCCVDIAQNKIKSIRGLRNLKHLRKIDLGANRIRIMEEEELEGLTNLEELWLGKNKIEKIEGISKVSTCCCCDARMNWRVIKYEATFLCIVRFFAFDCLPHI